MSQPNSFNEGQAAARPQHYQFTPEELKVLKECNRDSFFQRCLPLGTLLGVGAYYGVKGGYLKPSPRWGPTPKVLCATILGYFVGKLSYQTVCAERLMQLPDSKLGALLRQRKKGGGGFQESVDAGYTPGISLSPFSGMNPSNTYSDIDRSNTPDIDTTRPEPGGLDDSERPTVDSIPVYEEETMPAAQSKSTTYDELRKINREDYQKQRTSPYKDVTPSANVPPVRRPSTSSDHEFATHEPKKRTNIYGDIVE